MKEFWFILAIIAIISFVASIFLDRVVTPWQRKRWHKKFLKDFDEDKIQPHHYGITIHFDETGFGAKVDKATDQPLRMSWSEVVKVTA